LVDNLRDHVLDVVRDAVVDVVLDVYACADTAADAARRAAYKIFYACSKCRGLKRPNHIIPRARVHDLPLHLRGIIA
jgi:hypothetical protein